jgi:thiamine kinase-like enzyme
MVKIRPEFGFAEPHPRWGRVPVEQALDYTLMVLHSITIPLHKHLSQHEDQNWSSLATEEGQAWTYSGMCSVYEAELARISSILSSSECGLADSRLQRLVNVLRTCVDKMQEEEISNASPVLVHMDCQPQNLLMYSSPDKDSHIASVLDWEEAAYADPRFELLLLGRKVCANREQANVVWNTYQDEMNIQLGSIEPWLRLETVHSITTLVLQSMNLVGGGRSPWETKPDLWGKIERELHRLCGLGWNFCRSVILQ